MGSQASFRTVLKHLLGKTIHDQHVAMAQLGKSFNITQGLADLGHQSAQQI